MKEEKACARERELSGDIAVEGRKDMCWRETLRGDISRRRPVLERGLRGGAEECTQRRGGGRRVMKGGKGGWEGMSLSLET